MPSKSSITRRETIALVSLLIFALAIRLWRLGAFPDTLNPDEADTLQDALRIIYGLPPEFGFFGFDWKPQPAFSIYLYAGFIRVFGESCFALRLPSALFSTLALAPFWWILRRQVGALAALGGVFLLATSTWYLHFSRSGWENVHIALWMLGAMVCLLKLLDSEFKAWGWVIGVAVFCALGLYGYFGGRVILLGCVVFLLSLAVGSQFQRSRVLISAFVVMGLALMLFWPQVVSIRQRLGIFNKRTQAVLIFNSPAWQADPAGTARKQLVNNLTGFWWGPPNQRARYNPPDKPLLDYVTGLLLAVGLVASLAVPRYKNQIETRLWWVMLLTGWGLTQLLSTQTPDGARGVGWMAALFFFVALALDMITRWLDEKRWNWRLVLPILICGVGAFNLSCYVRWQSDPVTREARQPYIREDEFERWKDAVEQFYISSYRWLSLTDWKKDQW